jgi:uncharacterized protein YbaA (DUF1428 family)
MAYLDGFVAAVPEGNKEAFRLSAVNFAEIMKSHGAIAVVDAWGDDVPEGKVTSFPWAVKAEPGEVVTFGYIMWPSKAARDEGQKKAWEDPRMQKMEMPFDGKRMILGGFEIVNQV